MKMVYLNQVYDIFTLINHLIPQNNRKYENYGCTGVANMDADRKIWEVQLMKLIERLMDGKNVFNVLKIIIDYFISIMVIMKLRTFVVRKVSSDFRH